MKPMLIVGIIMIVLGGVVLAYRGFSYTEKETVLDIGPLKATADVQKNVPLPAILGWVLIAGGAVASGAALMRTSKS